MIHTAHGYWLAEAGPVEPLPPLAGDVSAETKDISHWWKNTGTETVVLISADLPQKPDDSDM